MPINRTTKTAAIAATAVLSLAGGAYAATNALTAPTPLTGSITDKVSDAALAKVPGSTLVGVESEPGGGYDAQIRKADGTMETLRLDATFKVTATQVGGRGFGGHGGGRGAFDTAALATSLGVDQSKLETALQQARQSSQTAERSAQAAAIAKSLSVAQSDVQSVLDAQQGAGGFRGHDDSALATALAKKFSVSQAKAQAALDSAHQARGAGDGQLAASLAKQLNLDTSKVQAALDAQRPSNPQP